MTHNEYKDWINRFWKYGAIDGSIRDDLLYRLDVMREDYAVVRASLQQYARYLPAKSRAAWNRHHFNEC
jgi:hypothetical protein